MRKIKLLLDQKHKEFNQKGFIADDPIAIPHRFKKKEDIEIIGFFMAILAWGQRKTIINSGEKLLNLFHHEPCDFIINHCDQDLEKCSQFVHRTFNGDDLLSMIGFLRELYTNEKGLEYAFSKHITKQSPNIENALNGFRKNYETSSSFIARTKKHIAYPEAGSACKRLNMYLRWMVRKDEFGVDFGIWKSIQMHQLICPLDVHVLNTAKSLGLVPQAKSDWKTALELTNKLKKFDKNDPVKYDFALFGIGIDSKNKGQANDFHSF